MTHVVCDSCINCRYTDCVDVCPVDCFHKGPNFLVIDPDECIDCALCVPECPVDAIFAEDDLSESDRKFLEINATLANSGKWPVLTNKIDACEGADKFSSITDKIELLDTNGVDLKKI